MWNIATQFEGLNVRSLWILRTIDLDERLVVGCSITTFQVRKWENEGSYDMCTYLLNSTGEKKRLDSNFQVF